MALSLHGLRTKIAAAARVKSAAAAAGRIPGGQRTVSALAARIDTGGEATDSYRGLLARLLEESIQHDDGDQPVYDPVAGILPGTRQPRTDPDTLAEAAWANSTAGRHIAAAAAYRKPYVADFDAAYTHYERAYRLNPNDLRAVEGAISLGARTHYDWPRIWRYAVELRPGTGTLSGWDLWEPVGRLFSQDPAPAAVAEAVGALEARGDELAGLHQLLLETLSVRLQLLGAFTAGFRLRSLMAQNRVAELSGIPLESALWLKHLLGAQAYLEDHQALAKTAATPRVALQNPQVRSQVAKLAADAALFTGEAAPLVAHAADRREQLTLPGEALMAELVEGRRVAVVGPAASQDQFGQQIEDHDVVVRTRHLSQPSAEQAARAGTRTDIAYYSGRDLMEGYDDVAAAAEAGQLKLAVTRPFYLEAFSVEAADRTPEWLRFARFEYGLYFRGAPQGIQRIIYDLLQFQPAQISLFHADFYAGEHAAVPGYRAGYGGFGPYAATNDVVMIHDLAYEFRMMQKLKATGFVTAYGTAAQVLELREQDYLSRLEAGPLGGDGS